MSVAAKKNFQTLQGRTARYQLRPQTAGGANPAGLALVSGAKDFGADQDFVAAGAITTEYWLCGAFLDTTDELVAWQVQFRDATPTLLFTFLTMLTAATPNIGMFAPPYPIFMAASAQLQGRAKATTIAKVLGVSALIATAL